MALIPCRDCGHEVSRIAPTCPRCGAPKPATRAAYDPRSRHCPICGGRIYSSDVKGTAVRCGGCGTTLAIPEVVASAAEKLRATEQRWARRMLWIGGAVVVVAMVAVGVQAREERPAAAAPAEPPVRHSDYMAHSMCERFVRRRLDTPSTAKFAPPRESTITHEGGGTYVVRSHLDAQNLFGAMVRSRFVCTTTYQDSARTWHLDGLDFL